MKFSPAYRPNHIQDVLCQMHRGQWFGFEGEQVYTNLVIHDDTKEKPTKAFLESELTKMQGEYDWYTVRAKRDVLLKETDYLALSDTTLPEPMRVYRQELRDIPQDFATPDIVIFPNKPDE